MHANTTVVPTPVSTSVTDIQAGDLVTTGGVRATVDSVVHLDGATVVTLILPSDQRISVNRA